MGHLDKTKESVIKDIPVKEGRVVYSEKSGMQFVDFAGERHTYGSILSGIYTNNYGFIDFTDAELRDIVNTIKDNGFVVDGQIVKAGNTVYQYRKVRDKNFIVKMNQTGIVMNKFKIGYAVYLPDFVEGDLVNIDFLIAIDNDVHEDKVFYVRVENNELDVSQCDDMNAIFNPNEFDISIIHDGNGLFTLSTTIPSTMNIISCTVNSSGSSIHEEFYIADSDMFIFYEWVNKSQLPYNVLNSSVVVYNDELHLLGGTNGETNHYKWDGEVWSKVSDLPFSLVDGNALVYKNEIHILNGTNHYKWNGVDWSKVSDLPYELSNGCAIAYLNDIHLLGGIGNLTSHYIWDGTEWSQATDIPFEFSNGSAVLYNRELHILGGTNHYKWDAAVWMEASTIPHNYANGSAVVYDGIINLIGGDGTTTDYYKWDGKGWMKVDTEIPYTFLNGNAVVYNNDVNILGGGEEGSTNHYEFYKGVR
jgi:hypothetical protein